MTQPASIVAPPYGDLWKVARVDTADRDTVTDEQRGELYVWLHNLGVPWKECRPELVVTQNGNDSNKGRLLLHLTRYPNGDRHVDYAANRVHTVPLVLIVDDYPAWLVQASHLQDQTRKGETP